MLVNLRDRDLQVFDRHRIFGAAVDEKLGRAGRVSRDQHAFKHLVRRGFHQRAVHERARVALVGVADQDLLIGLLGREEAPLVAGREAAASAAAQPGELHLVDHLLTGHRERLFQPLVTVMGDVILKAGRIDASGQRQHLDQLLRLAGGRDFKTAFRPDAEDVLHRLVVGFHVAVEHGIAVSQHDLHHRLGIAVAETAGAFHGNIAGPLPEQVHHSLGPGGHAAAGHADPDLLNLGVAHFASYSFRILIVLLRSSLP